LKALSGLQTRLKASARSVPSAESAEAKNIHLLKSSLITRRHRQGSTVSFLE
jgi:hypothetical protein